MLDRGFTIFRIRGIPIRIHITLILFLPYIALASSSQFNVLATALDLKRSQMHLPSIVWGVILAIGLFVSVLIHELAHSFVAQRYGVPVRSITLMMLGGISTMGHDDDAHEAWMAFAGPLASVVLAVFGFAAYRLLPLPTEAGIALVVFSLTNAVLGAFNLLPAFPMDGGRVLRGLLAGPLGHDKATQIATGMGKGVAVMLGLAGIFWGNFFMPLIAIFIYLGASAEEHRRRARVALRGVTVARIMGTRLGDACVDETVAAVAARLLRDDLPGARVFARLPDSLSPEPAIGIVTAKDLADTTAADATVGSAMPANRARVRVSDEAARALDMLLGSDGGALIVVDTEDQIVGLVTPAEAERALGAAAMRRHHERDER